MDRQDQVAAVVFCSALAPKTVDMLKTELLTSAINGTTRPFPDSRLGMALTAFTTAHIAPPTPLETEQARVRVLPLWDHEERARAAAEAMSQWYLHSFGLHLIKPQSMFAALLSNTHVL